MVWGLVPPLTWSTLSKVAVVAVVAAVEAVEAVEAVVVEAEVVEVTVVEVVEAVKAGEEVPRRAVGARAKTRRRTLRPSMRETLGLPLLPPSRPQELRAREG